MSDARLIEDIAALADDPLGYVYYNFPWGQPGTELANKRGPRKWQARVLKRIGEQLRGGAKDRGDVIREAIASGHGIGKSTLVAWLIKWAFDTMRNTRGVVTANTDTQLRTKTWPEVTKWHNLSLTKDWATCTATALYSNDVGAEKNWRIDATPWSVSNTAAFAGLHNEGRRILLLFDEASEIDDEIWEVADGALTDENTEIIWAAFGNPTSNSGRFRECFRRFKHRWHHENIDARTVEGTNQAEHQRKIDDWGIDSDYVKVRVRGMFPDQAAMQFISTRYVDAAYGRELRPEQYNFAPKILTLDNAWSGVDEGVIGLRQGLAFKILRTFPKNDNDLVVGQLLASLETEHDADAVFIDAGYGTGVYSYGVTIGRTWQLVWFAGESADMGCLNKRTEMYKGIRDWLKVGGCIPADPTLQMELTAVELLPRPDGKMQLESKDQIRERIGQSTGRADALALSFAHPVVCKPRGLEAEYFGRKAKGWDYDPHATAGR